MLKHGTLLQAQWPKQSPGGWGAICTEPAQSRWTNSKHQHRPYQLRNYFSCLMMAKADMLYLFWNHNTIIWFILWIIFAVYMKCFKCDILLYFMSFLLTQLQTSYMCLKMTNSTSHFLELSIFMWLSEFHMCLDVWRDLSDHWFGFDRCLQGYSGTRVYDCQENKQKMPCLHVKWQLRLAKLGMRYCSIVRFGSDDGV